ncbi:MAG: DNA-processing protein DprA [Polyangiaceae bacterium]
MDRTTLAPDAPEYPPALRLLARPPALRIAGRFPSSPGVAIVGTREPSPGGAVFAAELARGLAGARIPVWSGGAQGIDTEAHRGALGAGGVTIAVLGGGLAHPFPHQTAALFEEISAHGGAVVSPFSDDAKPAPWKFHFRNSVLASLASLVILVECGIPSGALNTMRWARTFGVPFAVVPAAPWSTTGAGCAAELVRGGRAIASVRDALRLFAEVQGMPVAAARHPPPSRRAARAPAQTELALEDEGDEATRAILSALSAPRSTGDLAERVGFTGAALAERLLDLAFSGRIVETAPGVYARATLSLGRAPTRE